jgi:type VI secretion system protein ImpK
MSERPEGEGADPDATVSGPATKARGAGGTPGRTAEESQDPDATVFHPGARPKLPNADAAVRGAPASAAEPEVVDPDATVARARPPSAKLAASGSPGETTLDPDATVARAGPPEPAPVPQTPASRGADPEATVAIPSPGRRRDSLAPVAEREVSAADLAALGGLNPLIAVANAVLGAVPQIRQTLKHPDADGLRGRLARQIEALPEAARAAAIPEGTVLAARYALCALLDDAASATPWGGGWAQRGLLWRIEGASADDGRIFAQLDTLAEDPAANAELLEFLYVCLALGYEGRHRGSPDGREKIAQLRQRLHELIRTRRAEDAGELSPHWRGIVTARPRFSASFALGAAGAGAALLLAAVYLGYALSLGARSDPVALEIARLKANVSLPAPAAPAPSAPRVSRQLATAIAQGEVSVTEDARRSTIEIRSDRLFASGSARVEPSVQRVILRVAEALDEVPGAILITGHTDDVPIRSARFPSNWELSTERARAVQKLMAQKLRDAGRVRIEGLADSEPAVPNDSAANRARNRRVVIILRASP